MKMKIAPLVYLLCALVGSTFAAEKDDAEKAATNILTSLGNQQYETVWNQHTSKVYQKMTTKDSFLANLSLGRAPMGKITDKQVIDFTYSTKDPTDPKFDGKIYAFNFKTTYSNGGKFYERIVVMQENDGKFRLAGLWGQPRP